jgi:ribosomal 50S subunit-recycling heat shock protein
MEMKDKHFNITVSKGSEGMRLDQFLSQTDLGLSRSLAKRLIEEGTILLNQKPANQVLI